MSKFTSTVMVLFPSKVLKLLAVIAKRWFSEATEVVGKWPAVLKVYVHRNMGINCGVSENTLTCYHSHPNCFQMLSWTCYTSGKSMPWNIYWSVSLCTVGKVAFNFWCHLLRGTLSNSCCSTRLLPLCRFSPGFWKKSLFDLKTLLSFSVCV